jgi:hypothetical protein
LVHRPLEERAIAAAETIGIPIAAGLRQGPASAAIQPSAGIEATSLTENVLVDLATRIRYILSSYGMDLIERYRLPS